MANRNNSARAKKTHGYRPYDTSNSFVKKITAKVSEILPQPTSWVSRWFNATPKLNVREREELEDEDDDDEERQPPSKRLCFSPSLSNDFSHQNNINRLNDRDMRERSEISPIAGGSRSGSGGSGEDLAVPGPSGLHLRHFPVSSTPAVRIPPPTVSGVGEKDEDGVGGEVAGSGRRRRGQQRDDGSDSSGSTSGCSSLVPGAGSHPRQESATPAAPQAHLNPVSRGGSGRRLSLGNSSINRTSMNLSRSSQPTFDPYVFNNPLNRSGIRKRLLGLGEESCFYSGNTTFGGASARTLSPTASPTRVVSVKASPTRQTQSDTIGASALKILRALEQFSTPVLDAKRMPVRKESERGRRRAPQPYEELILPSMPDLLRVRRQEEAMARGGAGVRSPSAPDQRPSTSQAPSQEPYEPPPPDNQHLHFQQSSASHTRVEKSRVIKGRSKYEEFEFGRVPNVNLPDVQLQISSIPKINLEMKCVKGKQDNVESDNGVQRCGTRGDRRNSPAKSPPFKFSQPQLIQTDSFKVANIPAPVSKFKFSEALEPLSNLPEPSSSSTPLEKPSTPLIRMKNPSPNLKPKRKVTNERESIPSTGSGFQLEIKPPTEMKNASVMDFFKTASEKSPKTSNDLPCENTNTSSKEETVNEVLSWKCLKCLLQNPETDTKCKSCGLEKGGTPPNNEFKGFEGFKKPKDTWECNECFVSNKNSLESCAACSTPKAGATKPTASNVTFQFPIANSTETKPNNLGDKCPSLFNSIKTPEGSWECSTCLVRNNKDDLACAACSTPKPGAPPSEKTKPSFTFGIPNCTSQSTGGFTFNAGVSTESAKPTITFGVTTDSKPAPVSSSQSVSNEKTTATSIPSSTSTTVTDSSASPLVPVVNSIKKAEGSWECDTCLVQNKKDIVSCVACGTSKPGSAPPTKPKETFSFGIPFSPSNSIKLEAPTVSSTSSNSVGLSQPQFTFGSGASLPMSTTPVLNFSTPSDPTQATNEMKPFSWSNSDQPVTKDPSKISSSIFSFGSNVSKENNSEDMNDEQPTKKKVSLTHPLSSENSLSSDKNTIRPFGGVDGNKSNETKSESTFVSKFSPFDTKKDSGPCSNSLFVFSTPTEAPKANSTAPSKPLAFGSMPSDSTAPAPTNSLFGNALGGFKSVERSESKPFTFMANSEPTGSQSGGFAFNPAASQPTPMFGQQQQMPLPTPAPLPALFAQPQEQKPFVFGAPPQQQPQPVFPFISTPQQQAPVVGGSAHGGFNFSAPPATPKFDPNIKPSFNFTGGATPSFTAMTPSSGSSVTERKVRKAIRRTTAHR